MNCKVCGAYIRADDRFCSKCGAPTELLAGEDAGSKKRLYNDKVFRDSFLDKNEEGHHALLVTLTVLLVVAVLAISVVFYFFILHHKTDTGDSLQQAILIQDASASAENGGQSGEHAAALETEEVTEVPEKETAEHTEAKATEKEVPETEEPVLEMGPIETIMSKENMSASEWAVFVYDLKTNRSYTAGDCDREMFTSATVTVPVLYTAAAQLDQGAIHLSDQLTYVNSIGGRGEAFPEQRDGKQMELSYFLTTMLRYSDNNCINCLIDMLGLENINRICKGAGFESTNIRRKIVEEVTDGTENTISARDLGLMTKELYNGKFDTIGREFMCSNFAIDETDANYTVLGLSPEIPPESVFLNQNGKGETRYSEVAVVSDDAHSYVISVMLTGDPGFTYEDALIEVSGYIYNHLC